MFKLNRKIVFIIFSLLVVFLIFMFFWWPMESIKTVNEKDALERSTASESGISKIDQEEVQKLLEKTTAPLDSTENDLIKGAQDRFLDKLTAPIPE